VAQDGTNASSFTLGYDSASGNWCFACAETDVTSPTILKAAGLAADTGTWHHLAGTFDTSTYGGLVLYVDGAYRAVTSVDPTPWTGTALTIGRGKVSGASAGFVDGSISDVAVYQRLLSSGDVAHIFGEGRTGDGSTITTATMTGGGGGSAGGAAGAGNDGSGSTGGAAVAPGGKGGDGGTPDTYPASAPGNNGDTPGAGGGGAFQDSGTAWDGGTGGSVWVRMTYQQSIPSLFPNFIAHIPNYEASDIAPFYVPLGSSGPEGSGTDLASGGTISVGGSITSPRGLFKLKVQADGNMVVYHPGLRGGIGDGPADWSTKTAGSGSSNYLEMEAGGNLVLHGSSWSSGTSSAGAHLELMPDGMLVIFDTSGNPIWSNRRFPNTTMTVSPNDVADDGSVCFNARWNGTYSILLAPLLWAHPTVQRTMTATITQYGFQGGLPYVQTLSCFTKPSSWANGIVTIGEMTIPDRELPPENTGAYYTVSFDTGDPDDRLLDALFFDSMGQLVTINVSGAGYSQYYIDEPTPDVDVGYISGSMRDRKWSVGVMSSTFVSGGPLTLQTGMTQIFLYSINGAPALIASYFPRWFVDLWDV
jgi:hypothetical protein